MSHLIFTRDFHEIVRGKLQQGGKCRISYDPLRLIPFGEGYIHDDPDTPITAHISFDMSAEQETLLLYSETGQTDAPVIADNGLGSMLTAYFVIPPDAREITVWFFSKDKDGSISYDSDFGNNFHFRIDSEDLKIVKASVVNYKNKPEASFEMQIDADPAVDSLSVYYRQTNKEKIDGHVDLVISKKGKRNKWASSQVMVPYGSVIVYEISYKVAGEVYQLNNNGNYFIAEVIDK